MLTIGCKTADFYRVLVVSGSDKFDLCKLDGGFTGPVINDYDRLL